MKRDGIFDHCDAIRKSGPGGQRDVTREEVGLEVTWATTGSDFIGQ